MNCQLENYTPLKVGEMRIAEWEPGNGTRYTVLFGLLRPEEARMLGYGSVNQVAAIGITPGDGALAVTYFAMNDKMYLDRITYCQRRVVYGTANFQPAVYEATFGHIVTAHLLGRTPINVGDHTLPPHLPDAISELKQALGLYSMDEYAAHLQATPDYEYKYAIELMKAQSGSGK